MSRDEVCQGEAGHIRETHVENEKIVDTSWLKECKRRSARVHPFNRVACLPEYPTGHVADHGLIVHHQDCCGHAQSCAPKGRWGRLREAGAKSN